MRRILIVPAALLVLAGCSEDITGPSIVACNDILTSFQALSGDTVTTAEGVRYFDVEVGTGATATLGATVDVNYTLYSVDGTRLDTSCGGSATVFRFLLGGQGVIPGFQIGVVGMREGGVRRVLVPANLAYGDQDLMFDIQLVDQL